MNNFHDFRFLFEHLRSILGKESALLNASVFLGGRVVQSG